MKVRNFVLNSLRVFLVANILLLIASFFYPFVNFFNETILSLVVTLIGLLIRRLKYVSFLFIIFYYVMFLVYNLNYGFILGLCLVVGLLVIDFIKPQMNINALIYILIPIFIFGHVLMFEDFTVNNENILDNISIEDEFGVNESIIIPRAGFYLDIGSQFDNNSNSSIFISSLENLSNRECFNESCYRNLDGSMEISFTDLGDEFLDSVMYVLVDFELINSSSLEVIYSNQSDTLFEGINFSEFRYDLSDKLILNGSSRINSIEIIIE